MLIVWDVYFAHTVLAITVNGAFAFFEAFSTHLINLISFFGFDSAFYYQTESSKQVRRYPICISITKFNGLLWFFTYSLNFTSIK